MCTVHGVDVNRAQDAPLGPSQAREHLGETDRAPGAQIGPDLAIAMSPKLKLIRGIGENEVTPRR